VAGSYDLASAARDHVIELLGGIKLANLKAHDVQGALEKLATRIEQIADAVGHASTRTTDTVYRHQIRPIIRTAAALDPLFTETAG